MRQSLIKAILTLLTMISSVPSFATEWLTYYVYFETEYLQGPWIRLNMVEPSNYQYLSVEVYEDLFGSEDEQLVQKMISRLRDKKSDLYTWAYDLSFQGDTVVITTQEQLNNLATIKNEITATLTFNHFKAVTFNLGTQSETLTHHDLTLPYFDLVFNTTAPLNNGEISEASIEQHSTIKTAVTNNPWSIWLILSLLINFGLIAWLTLLKTNKTS
jgi:hypothetical protein